MFRLLRSVVRSVKVVAMFLYGALELVVTRPATREQRAEWLHRFCARTVVGMGIRMRAVGRYPESGVLISNHLGYLDIMVYAALHRCVFVSKAELKNEPLLGWMTTMAGTVYVERGRGGSAVRASSGMKAASEAGLPVVFFPEGTTSNGTSVLKFRSGLLAQAMEAGQPVTAAFVRYRLTEDNGPGVSVEDDVCYWGDDVTLFRHIFRLVALKGIEVEVTIAEEPIVFTADAAHRKTAAVEARAAVMEVGGVREPLAAG